MGLSYVKLAVAAGALAAAFGGGWLANGWRLGERITEIERDHAQAQAAQWKEATRETSRLADLAATLQGDVIAATAAARKQLEEAQNETNRLRRCLDNGTCGLRVNVVGPAACPGAVPAPTGGGPVGAGTSAALAPDSQQAYFDLRAGIELTEGKLAACQAIVRKATSPSPAP